MFCTFQDWWCFNETEVSSRSLSPNVASMSGKFLESRLELQKIEQETWFCVKKNYHQKNKIQWYFLYICGCLKHS